MKWAQKSGVALALLAGLVASVWLVWAIGFGAVLEAVARAGFGGLALLCAYSLLVIAILALAWMALLPPMQRRGFFDFFFARLVRDSVTDLSPFSSVGGMVAAARVMIVRGMGAAIASASVAADATTEMMAQAAFLAFGFAIAFAQLRHMSGGGPLLQAISVVLLLAVPAIAFFIFLQKRGAAPVERLAARFFPTATGGSFHAEISALYDSPRRLAASAALHLIGWIASSGINFIAFALMGGHITIGAAIAMEALLCTLRSVAIFVPAAVGVQEAGYAVLAPLFGLPAEMGLAVSLLKRAREIVLGVPALIYWQTFESRKAFANG
jgi:glycosyltransferase 2 family protein